VPLGERSGFVVKLAPGAGPVVYSTYLAGAAPTAIAVDSAGHAHVVGSATTGFIETTPIAEANSGSGHAFLARLSGDGTALTFSTLFGGDFDEAAWTVAADDHGYAYVAGGTLSSQFPTKNAFQPAFADDGCGVRFFAFGDGFVTKFNTAQPGLVYSTYLGGTSADSVLGLAADASGAAYVTGWTNSTDFPTRNALQAAPGSAPGDAFAAKISPSGSELIYSTYLGGNGNCGFGPAGCCIGGEGGNAIAIAADGTAWVAGFTNASDFPLTDPLQAARSGYRDAFVAAIAPDGLRLVFSTYLGGTGADDSARGIAVAPDGDVVLGGFTDSPDFPTPNGAFPSYAGGTSDGFVVRIAAQATALTVSVSATPTSGPAPLAVSFTGTRSGGTGYYTTDWDFGDGSPHSSQLNPSHVYTVGGTYTARLTVTDSAAATASATVTISVQASCYLSCTASAPLAASVLATSGLAPVPFSASALVSPDCPSSPTFAWTFGDGQTSTEEDPSHVYPAPGAYDWTMTASVAGRTCTRHGTVVVTQLGEVETLRIVPAVAHNDGFLGSKWRTDLALVNASTQPAGLSLVFFGSDGPIVRTASLAGGASREWHDLLVSLFGLADDAVARGTVQLASDAPVALAARTYNLSPSGTYGQTFPALALGEGVASGQGGLIAGLKKTSAFRTNLGVVNTSTQESTVRIALYDASGAPLGAPLTVTVPAGHWIQIDDVFGASGAAETELAFASIEVLTPATSAWAYAAVIDNATGDPTTVPVTVP
jgi:PKD repeat protein